MNVVRISRYHPRTRTLQALGLLVVDVAGTATIAISRPMRAEADEAPPEPEPEPEPEPVPCPGLIDDTVEPCEWETAECPGNTVAPPCENDGWQGPPAPKTPQPPEPCPNMLSMLKGAVNAVSIIHRVSVGQLIMHRLDAYPDPGE